MFELYNNQVDEYNYNAQAWNDAAEDILEDENREFYESTIKIDKSLLQSQLPERVNLQLEVGTRGAAQYRQVFSADFGTHIFAQKTDEERYREMLGDEGYLSAMKNPMGESFNLGSSDYLYGKRLA